MLIIAKRKRVIEVYKYTSYSYISSYYFMKLHTLLYIWHLVQWEAGYAIFDLQHKQCCIVILSLLAKKFYCQALNQTNKTPNIMLIRILMRIMHIVSVEQWQFCFFSFTVKKSKRTEIFSQTEAIKPLKLNCVRCRLSTVCEIDNEKEHLRLMLMMLRCHFSVPCNATEISNSKLYSWA